MIADYDNVYGGLFVFNKDGVECSYLVSRKKVLEKEWIETIIKHFKGKGVECSSEEIINAINKI